ncbi:MAG: sensor domain-containing protein [Actinobacteria bacterium]|nr:sensor domain-containing protein [Actinomycetota bacterium]
MNRRTVTAGGHTAPGRTGTDIATGRAASLLRRVLVAPFSRRAWAELWYVLVSAPLAVAGFAFTAGTALLPVLAAASAPGVRKLGDASRSLARDLLGEDWPAAAGDGAAWRTRGYLVLKLPLAVAGLAAAAACWLGGLFLLTFPAWWALLTQLIPAPTAVTRLCRAGAGCTFFPAGGSVPGARSFHFLVSVDGIGTANLARHQVIPVLLGAALLLAAPWLTRAVTEADRSLIRRLLGPASRDERVRALQETRARAVDDSAARLRGIERDLHDGTQAQLVALAMKLGLAKEKLAVAAPDDMARATQLVDDAHRGAIEAIADLRVLARGIHPPALDNGLADALATLAARSTLPVELVTDIPERPTAAIEAIAYFSAAELLTNAARHSGARHVTLEAVHVPGLLRIRVSDDGEGGARLVPRGGLDGLAGRARTVDGRLDISSPPGGPTVVTVELPSHA